MKYSGLLAIAAALSLSTGVYAAQSDFDKSVSGVLDVISTLAPGPQPGHQGPGGPHQGPGGPQQGPGGDHHPGPGGYPPPQPPQPWNPPHPPPMPHPYSPVYPDMNCQTWEFTAQTPNTRTEKLLEEEQSFDCYTDHKGTQYCRPTGNYISRKVTVNIGPRKLEAWEKESLKVCLESARTVRLDTAGMLYEYSVTSKDHDSFFGTDSTEFSLTPGAKKPSNPDGKELSMTSIGVAPSGELMLTLSDARAGYFNGEKIDISVDGMRIPVIDPNAPIQDILDSFLNIKTQASFDVAPTYTLKLLDKPKPGKYTITVKFTRRGPLSSSASASTMEIFDLP